MLRSLTARACSSAAVHCYLLSVIHCTDALYMTLLMWQYYLSNAQKFQAYLPLNKGNTFQTEIGPREENCPSANSRKKSGRPAKTSMMTYGIRKLAATQTHDISWALSSTWQNPTDLCIPYYFIIIHVYLRLLI